MSELEVIQGALLMYTVPIVLTFLFFNFATAFVVEAWASVKLLLGDETWNNLVDLSWSEVRSPTNIGYYSMCLGLLVWYLRVYMGHVKHWIHRPWSRRG